MELCVIKHFICVLLWIVGFFSGRHVRSLVFPSVCVLCHLPQWPEMSQDCLFGGCNFLPRLQMRHGTVEQEEKCLWLQHVSAVLEDWVLSLTLFCGAGQFDGVF